MLVAAGVCRLSNEAVSRQHEKSGMLWWTAAANVAPQHPLMLPTCTSRSLSSVGIKLQCSLLSQSHTLCVRQSSTKV